MICPKCACDIEAYKIELARRKSFEEQHGTSLKSLRTRAKFFTRFLSFIQSLLLFVVIADGFHPEKTVVRMGQVFSKPMQNLDSIWVFFICLVIFYLIFFACLEKIGFATPRKEKELWGNFNPPELTGN